MPVIFQPWIGNFYRTKNRFGVRVLVLGESHYGDEADTRPTVTTEVVRWLAQDERHAFFTKVSKVLLGLDENTSLSNEARGEVWEHIAFYNYIQGFVSTDPRVRPTADMWERAKEPFLQIVRDLNLSMANRIEPVSAIKIEPLFPVTMNCLVSLSVDNCPLRA
jgi:hypothetical protein